MEDEEHSCNLPHPKSQSIRFDAKQTKGCVITISSYIYFVCSHVAARRTVSHRVACRFVWCCGVGAMMSVPWRRAAGRSAKSSTANCQWLLADTLMKPRSDATWHDSMVIYGDIVVVYGYILRYDVNTINHNWNTIFVELFLYHLFNFCPDPLPSNQLSSFPTLDEVHSVTPAA